MPVEDEIGSEGWRSVMEGFVKSAASRDPVREIVGGTNEKDGLGIEISALVPTILMEGCRLEAGKLFGKALPRIAR